MLQINSSSKEEDVLKFWDEHKIFEKTLIKNDKCPLYNFYDGPPFASGPPHVGHVFISIIKDVVTRYWTMKGYKVERRIGWDCHGLPIENLVEKELGIKNKSSIESLAGDKTASIAKFNQACKDIVFKYLDVWKGTFSRIGRWTDYHQQYATLDNSYMESVWWVFKMLHTNQLIYQDYRVCPYCPRCETGLSNFEVNLGYRDVDDKSIYVKFKIQKPLDNNLPNNSYFLVWTTTPWTLPGNVALAINKNLFYALIKIQDEYLIITKDRLSVFVEGDYKIIKIMKGVELIGVSYDAFYNVSSLIKAQDIKNFKNIIHQVYHGDFVSSADGSGVVHIAPAFGEDDMTLSKQNKLPVFITVDAAGRLMKGLNLPGEGELVKNANIAITQDLDQRKLLWKEEVINHSYPFCWRCDHYLIYYPLTSWYVNVVKIKAALLANNKKINWSPQHIKNGRFGKWLDTARDWAISRTRFWGVPIPAWSCVKCHTKKIMGSIEELALATPSGNKFIVIRHTEAEHNVNKVLNEPTFCNIRKSIHLTAKGVAEAKKISRELRDQTIDLIMASEFLRTQETAKLINSHHNIPLVIDPNLNDINPGVFTGKLYSKLTDLRNNSDQPYLVKPENGESYQDVENRVTKLFEKLNQDYKNKTIVIVTHGAVIRTIYKYFNMKSEHQAVSLKVPWGSKHIFHNNIRDLHRPYIDNIVLKCSCGGEMRRVEDVLDCWFESGSMPYASWHYPFENKEKVEKIFPADFIVEALDQTRGWFYTLHVLASALTIPKVKLSHGAKLGKLKPAYKNVSVTGLILAEDGKKLSKKLKNYTDIDVLFQKYGVDSLRYFLLTAVQFGEDFNLSEKNISDSQRNILITLQNVYSFYEMYNVKKSAKSKKVKIIKPKHILDKWILSKLHALIKQMTLSLNKHDIVGATRLIGDFINSLSTWYLRRSRDRIKQNPEFLGFILSQVAVVIAPFMPFKAEVLYQSLNPTLESVHLENWPVYNAKFINNTLHRNMDSVLEVVEIAHSLRSESGIKIRQPLSCLKIQGLKLSSSLNKELLGLIQDELNIKTALLGADKSKTQRNWISKKYKKLTVAIDLTLTPELKQEGLLRELIRQINSYRKNKSLTINDKVVMSFFTEDEDLLKVINDYTKQLKDATLCSKIMPCKEMDFGDEILVNNAVLKIKLIKRS